MKRRSFLAGLTVLPFFGIAQKTPARDLAKFTNYPVNLTEPITLDPFIEINLDNGPVTIHGITFSVSDFMPVRLTYGVDKLESVPPTESSIKKLREILKSNGGDLRHDGNIEIVWGPDTYPTWVKVYREESDTAFLLPLSSGEFSKSEFINDCTKNYTDHAWRFYHIVCGKYNNFWSIGV